MPSKIYTAPNPTPIFHMLTIENFKNVLCYGGLLCRNLLVSSGIKCDDISYGNIQERRHQIYVNDPQVVLFTIMYLFILHQDLLCYIH